MWSRVVLLLAVFLSAAHALTPARATALQIVAPGTVRPHEAETAPDRNTAEPDSARLNREARSEQAAFERVRRSNLSWTWEGGSGCDERIGRMCWNHDPQDRDWHPPPDPPAVTERRAAFLQLLEETAVRIPGDAWVAGQRIRYLGEEDRWDEAEEVARACIRDREEDTAAAPSDPSMSGDRLAGRCHDLLGYVFHRTGRAVEAEEAFRGALARMDARRVESRLDPRGVAEPGAARLLNPSTLSPDSLAALRGRFWFLSDPLWLVPGNDRWTEHQARFAAAHTREESRNPHSITWGTDLMNVLVRYGESIGWQRIRDRLGSFGDVPVVGHGPNGARTFLPPGEVLADPTASPPDGWDLHPPGPRSIHAPLYASRIGPLDGVVARFLRPDGALIMAAFARPASDTAGQGTRMAVREGATSSPTGTSGDSTEDGGEGAATRPILPPFPGPPLEAGLFLVAPDGSGMREVRREGEESGGLALQASPGDYVLGLELLDREIRRGWRTRHGLNVPVLIPDLAGLSDLLLIDPSHLDPADSTRGVTDPLEVLDAMLPRAEIPVGGSVGVVWEVYGTTPGEAVRFEATLRPVGRGFLRRAGEWLRLLDPEPVTRVAWEDQAFESSGAMVRTLHLDLADVAQGQYELRLRAELAGRSPVEASRLIDLVAGPRVPPPTPPAR